MCVIMPKATINYTPIIYIYNVNGLTKTTETLFIQIIIYWDVEAPLVKGHGHPADAELVLSEPAGE